MAAEDDINRELREFKRYTGDGLPGEPTGAPLPIGDPSSGVHNPKKSGLRALFMSLLASVATYAAQAQAWAEAAAEVAIPDGGINADMISNDPAEQAAILAKLGGGEGGGADETLIQSYWMPSNMELAETAALPLLIGMGEGNGTFDGFNSLTWVDVAGATGLDISESGALKPALVGGAAYANAGGMGNRPSITVTSSMTAAGGSAPTLVDGAFASGYAWGAEAVAGKYLRFDFGAAAAKYIAEFKLYMNASAAHGTWRWQGSNDATTWVNIGDPFALSSNSGNNVVNAEIAKASALYRYFQLLGVSGNSSGAPYLQEAEFKIDTALPTIAALAVRSAVINLSEAPEWGRLVAIVLENDAGVNSDVVFKLSRNGSAFATLVMAEKFTRSDGSIYVDSGIVDLTGIASGTTARWRVETANNKSPKIKAIGTAFGVAA